MGTLRGIYTLVFICALQVGFAQEEEVILWQADEKLSWQDFKANPPQSDRIAAVTASGITYEFSSVLGKDKVEIDFTVSTFFYPNKSWYKPKICDTVVLGHEQLHFDISELFARKMRKKLMETRFTKNVKAEVRSIYKQILRELNDFQNKYDSETNFSRNREQQVIWNTKIRNALNGS